MVLLRGREMESSIGLLGETLRAVITCRDFEVKASEFPALVFVLDAQVRNRNFVVHNVEVVFIRDPNPFVAQFLIGSDARQLPVELLIEVVVEDDPTDLAVRMVNLPSSLVIKTVEIGVVAGFLRFDQPKISRLLRGQLSGFSTERLMQILMVLGRDVDTKRAPRSRHQGSLPATDTA
jgi:hypothetical protein